MKVAYTIVTLEAKADRVLAWRAPLAESIPFLAELGYDGVELMVRAPEEFDGAGARRLIEQHGLAVAAVGTGPLSMERDLSLSSDDDDNRLAAIRACKAAIELSGVLGARLTIGAFRGRCEPRQVDAAKQRLRDSLERLLPTGEQHDVRLCVEPQNRFQSSFFRTVDETLSFIKNFDSRHLGLSIDTFHMNIEESRLEDAVRAAASRCFYVQLADNHRGAPGSGMFAWESFRQILAEINYDGWLSMEISQTDDSREAARAAILGYRQLLGDRPIE